MNSPRLLVRPKFGPIARQQPSLPSPRTYPVYDARLRFGRAEDPPE
jgi:hypothetical protein